MSGTGAPSSGTKAGDWEVQSEFLVRLLGHVTDEESAQKLVSLVAKHLLAYTDIERVERLQVLVRNQPSQVRGHLRKMVAAVSHSDAGYVAHVLTGDPKPVVVDGSNVTGEVDLDPRGRKIAIGRLDIVWKALKRGGYWPIYTVVDPGEPSTLKSHAPEDDRRIYEQYRKEGRIHYVKGPWGKGAADLRICEIIKEKGWEGEAFVVTTDSHFGEHIIEGRTVRSSFAWLQKGLKRRLHFWTLDGKDVTFSLSELR
jgi:hypothetical protein